ncbi:hypothetical protein ACW4TU_43805 [Streptomyces sp. QTS52]
MGGGRSGLQVTADVTVLGFSAMTNPVQGRRPRRAPGGTRFEAKQRPVVSVSAAGSLLNPVHATG